MSQSPLPPTQVGAAGGPPLGVLDALGMSWRLLTSDFWPLWTAALVAFLVFVVSGMVPFGSLVTLPPLAAGLIYVLMRRLDGHPVTVGQVFEGFRVRFAESLVALLPLIVVMLLNVAVLTAVSLAVMLPVLLAGMNSPTPDIQPILKAYETLIPLTWGIHIPVSLVMLFLCFAPAALWDGHPKGWDAAKRSARLVLDHLWPMLGFWIIYIVVNIVSTCAGLLLCCVGGIVLAPVVYAWFGGATILLYRSWTGQPLVQTVVEVPAE
jgi:hypothetical protein